MFEPIQYRAIMFCPFSLTEEEVFSHIIEQDGQAMLAFDGCDHQFHKCDECVNCWNNAHDQFMEDMK